MSILSIEMATGFKDFATEESKRCRRSVHIVTEAGTLEVAVGEQDFRHRARHARGVLLGRIAHLHAFDDLYANHTLRSIVDKTGRVTTTLVEGSYSWILGVATKSARYMIGMDGSSVLVGSVSDGTSETEYPRQFQFEDVLAVCGIITNNGS